MNQLALPTLRRKIADTFSPEVVVVSDNDGEKESILPASILNDVISTEINKSSICIRATKSLGSLKDVNTPAIRNEDIYRSDTPQIRHQLKDQEPQFKRRRFQRRNSATAAMLFSQMQGTNFTQPTCPEEDQISKIIADSVIHGISRGNCDFACIDEDQDQPR